MDLRKKGMIYKNMFLIFTLCGVVGLYIMYKFETKWSGYFLCGLWLVLAVLVRILIMKDKKYFKNNKV